ncbi:hypothetical protein [Streptomyces eurythermus]
MRGVPASLVRAPAAGPLVFDLCAGAAGRSWRPFAVLTVRSAPPAGPKEGAGFGIHEHDARGFTPGPAPAAVHRAAYRGSRAGRRG